LRYLITDGVALWSAIEIYILVIAVGSDTEFKLGMEAAAVKLVLYYAPIACSLVPYVTLTEAGVDFETRTVNLRKKQQRSSEFLNLNPKHKVPVLLIDGKPLTENVAIQQWIARTFPKAMLMPADPWEELQAISIHSWCASGMHPLISRINGPAKVCDIEGTEESVRRLATDMLLENFRHAETLLDGRNYFFDHFTAADAHFFWCLRRAKLLNVNVSGLDVCEAHFQRMLERPSVQKVISFEKKSARHFLRPTSSSSTRHQVLEVLALARQEPSHVFDQGRQSKPRVSVVETTSVWGDHYILHAP